MIDSSNSMVAQKLAKRIAAVPPEAGEVLFADRPLPDGLRDHLRKHLAGGETHYTTRPGLTELRSAIGREIHHRGGPDRNAEDVIVTHGEGEALFVTLLGLEVGLGAKIALEGPCRHLGLLDLLGIRVVGSDDPEAANAHAFYREAGEAVGQAAPVAGDERFEVLALADLLFSERAGDLDLSLVSNRAICVGHLDSLPGLDHFRMGFVAGPADLVKRIQTWKQAFSICSAAPSQRAAMFAISGEGGS
jgi:DNA-binding transcriptional MocR family regulator